MDILKKFEDTIKENKLIDKGVIACVSGGADSVCMLYLIFDYCIKNNKEIICAHFNHGIRGSEADADEEFVRNICKVLNIEFVSTFEDIPALAKKLSKGIEETAREARYEFFNKLALKHGYSIATAHNRNDRVETIIHNILRGTSIDGLKGISYVRDNIVRPMLDIDRSWIEEYLKINKLEYRNDSTNIDTMYTRNRIRHIIIPFLKEQYGQNIDDSLLRLSDLSLKDSEYLNMMAEKSIQNVILSDTNVRISVFEYSNLHYSIRSRILIKALSMLRNEIGEYIYNAGTGIEMSIINRLDDFIINGMSGKYVEASKGVIARKEQGSVVLLLKDNICDSIGVNNIRLESEIVSISDFNMELLKDHNYACFDYDTLNDFTRCNGIKLRTRQDGDLFNPFGFNGVKKLKKFFIDEKIPLSKRNSILLLTSGSNILWIPGIRRSGNAPIDNHTENVIIFRLHKNNVEDIE